jgi:hypothetical protein
MVKLSDLKCHNPSLGFAINARVCKGAGQEWSLKITFHAPGSVRECEGMNPHIPKWAPTLGVGVSMDFQIFKWQFQGLKLIGLESFLDCWNLLERKCLKCTHMIHLITLNINYGQKKGWESNCQFDFRPLKVENRPDLLMCRWHATYHLKALDKDYNFSFYLTLIGGLQKKVISFQSHSSPNLGIPRQNDIWV